MSLTRSPWSFCSGTLGRCRWLFTDIVNLFVKMKDTDELYGAVLLGTQPMSSWLAMPGNEAEGGEKALGLVG